MSVLADPRRSHAVLIGASRYDSFDQLPAVAGNLSGLRSALTDPAIWGLSTDRCAVLPDPHDPAHVMDALQHAAVSATDTLIVYFAGHAFIDEADGNLYLALPRSSRERLYRTGLRYDWIRRHLQRSPAVRRILILDLRHYPRPQAMSMGGDADGENEFEAEGSVVVVAATPSVAMFAPAGGKFTSFTGELITLLSDGIPRGPALLDVDSLFDTLNARRRTSRLAPARRTELDVAGDFAFARNRHPTAQPDAAWSDRIDPTREPIATELEPAGRPDRRQARAFVIGLLIWTAGSTWLIASQHSWWLAAVAIMGRLTLLSAGLRMMMPSDRVAWFGVPFAVMLTGWSLFGASSGLVRGEALALLLVFVGTMLCGTVGVNKARRSGRDERILRRRHVLADIVRTDRWITLATADSEDRDLLAPLSAMVAARFARLGEGHFRYVVAAGTRVLLVAIVDWPSMRRVRLDESVDPIVDAALTTLAAGATRWREWFESRQSVVRASVVIRPVVVVRAAVRSDRSTPKIQEIDGLVLTTTETFAHAAGSFLVPGAHELNMAVLEEILLWSIGRSD